MKKIPATIITGFLGAGKTSLIRHLMGNAGGRRIALIINEFGEVGVDREMLLGCGIESCAPGDIIELANGCICCTVADDFLPTMTRLLERSIQPEHIVIETSGLALPKPLVQAFTWPEVKARSSVDGVIVMIDAERLLTGIASPAATATPVHDNPVAEVFEDQLALADLVILNKTDLVEGQALDRAEAALRARLRPAVKLMRAAHGALPPSVLLGLAAATEEDLANRPTLHDLEAEHDHEDFESFVVTRGPIADMEGFLARLGSVISAHEILRCKGFLDLPGKEFRHVVQAVGARLQAYFDRPWRRDETRLTRLVVIGQKGLDRAAIAMALQG
ncbi:MAG TPA: cobalamin biosynthesis protein CobW [Stellaceae bacterium]|nr:cobalamin biosynthesis protein CobW [Stellaceae bacterium]